MLPKYFVIWFSVAAFFASTAFADTRSMTQRTSPVTPPQMVKQRTVQEQSPPADALVLTPPVKKRDPFNMFSGGPAGYLLSQYLKTTVEFTPDAARRERMAMMAIHKAPPQVRQQMVSEIMAAYQRLPEMDYDRRWLLVNTLAQLGDEKATEAFGTIALSALPPERLMRKKNTEWSSRDEEVSIRLAAVRGLNKLAARKISMAEQKLIFVANRSPLVAVRKQAIMGYVFAPTRSLKTGTMEGFSKSPLFAQRLMNIKNQLPPDARKMADEVTSLKPDISTPVAVRNAIMDRSKRIEPQIQDPPPIIRKGGRP